MWDPAWLRNRSFWMETGLFLFFIVLIGVFAVVKFNRPGQVTTPTPSLAPPPQTFYYLETDPANSTSTVLRSNVSTPEDAVSIAVFRHASGAQPTGSLSPDGTRIALLISEPDATPADVANGIGKVWLLSADGSYFQRAISDSTTWFAWRQDGLALASFSPPDGDTQKSRVSKLNLVTGTTTVLEEQDAATQTIPLGWSSGGEDLVLIGLNSSNRWAVYSVKADSGSRVERITLVEGDTLRNAWISPNGAYVLIDLVRSQEALLLLFSLDGRQRATVASVGVGMMSNPPAYNPVWSANGERILINQPSPSLTETTWKTFQVDGSSGTPVYLGEVDPTHYLRPLDWSSDDQWLAMIESPYPSTHLFVKQIAASDRVRILLKQDQDQAAWLGFAPSP